MVMYEGINMPILMRYGLSSIFVLILLAIFISKTTPLELYFTPISKESLFLARLSHLGLWSLHMEWKWVRWLDSPAPNAELPNPPFVIYNLFSLSLHTLSQGYLSFYSRATYSRLFSAYSLALNSHMANTEITQNEAEGVINFRVSEIVVFIADKLMFVTYLTYIISTS